MGKHTPLIRYQAARTAYDWACQDCTHWDYEDDAGCGYECCYRLDDAKRELDQARKAWLAKP